jgi:excisionase family DNA binding protein
MGRRLLVREELAARLRVSPRTIQAWVRNGLIPVIRISSKVLRFDWDDVVAALKRKNGPVPPTKGDA